jgi:hypothetical protein
VVGSAAQILDGDDVQGVDGYDLTIPVHHSNGARRDQDQLRMANGVFPTIRRAQGKRLKPAPRDALANRFQIDARTLSAAQSVVNELPNGDDSKP